MARMNSSFLAATNPARSIERWVIERVAFDLDCHVRDVDQTMPLAETGIDSGQLAPVSSPRSRDRDHGHGPRPATRGRSPHGSPPVTFVATDAEPLGDPGDWQMPELTGETIAFLRYTSGSTSEPKSITRNAGFLSDADAFDHEFFARAQRSRGHGPAATSAAADGVAGAGGRDDPTPPAPHRWSRCSRRAQRCGPARATRRSRAG